MAGTVLDLDYTDEMRAVLKRGEDPRSGRIDDDHIAGVRFRQVRRWLRAVEAERAASRPKLEIV